MSENPLQENPALLSVIGFLLTGNYYFGIIVAAGLLGFLVKFPAKFKINEALQLDASDRMQMELQILKLNFMKKTLFVFFIGCLSLQLAAQKENEEKEKVPFKENLFTGGTISLAFYNNTFLVGGNPVFGFSITNWADLGIVVNYNYTSYRDYNYVFNDKLRQSVYGGGGFVKLYPVRFLFAQVQVEHNEIKQKFIPNIGTTQTYKIDAGSFLVGGGYTSGRQGRGGEPFFYLAVLFDISDNINSPYTDAYGRIIPIVRGGIQVPLFQGSGKK